MPEEKVGTIEKRYGGEGDDIFIFAGSQYGSFQAANQARQRALERAAEDKPETPATDEPEKKYYGDDEKWGEVEPGAETYSLVTGKDQDVASSGNTYKVGTGPNPDLKAGTYNPDQARQQVSQQRASGTLKKPTPPTLKKADIKSDPDEFLTTANKLLEGTKRVTAAKAKEEGLDVRKPQEFDVRQAEATRVAGQERTTDAQQLDEPTYEIDDLTQTVSEKAIAQAQTEALDQKALVQYQLEQLYSGFKDGNIPPWASGPARKASQIMLQRGLGSSSMAAAAISQSIQEGAMPIAQADAQSYATIQLQNLSNKHQTVLANAATYAAMDRANLDARTTAAVTNAQNFLAIDTANLSNRQQSEVFNAQAHNQFMLSDQASDNAMEQLNTKNQVDIDRFFSQLGVQIDEANSARNSALRQFNTDQENTVEIFNTKTSDQRERFNSEMKSQIEAANTQWRRQITTINNANQNAVNQFAAQSTLTYDLTEYQQLWQQYRDDAARIFSTTENDRDRAVNVAIAQLSSDDSSANRKAASRNALISGIGSIAGSLLGGWMKG
tara:strand:+ start:111 stop:1772 length:1662 start_codon:yes stop_codon:yes gene_type:complete